MEISAIEYDKLLTEIENLKTEKNLNTLELRVLRGNVEKIITNFWMWYRSGSFKRDFNYEDEGKKYAKDFLNDLVCEVSEVVK